MFAGGSRSQAGDLAVERTQVWPTATAWFSIRFLGTGRLGFLGSRAAAGSSILRPRSPKARDRGHPQLDHARYETEATGRGKEAQSPAGGRGSISRGGFGLGQGGDMAQQHRERERHEGDGGDGYD